MTFITFLREISCVRYTSVHGIPAPYAIHTIFSHVFDFALYMPLQLYHKRDYDYLLYT